MMDKMIQTLAITIFQMNLRIYTFIKLGIFG
jgi:hypothetical protein